MKPVSDILAELNQAIGYELTAGHNLTDDINDAGEYIYAAHDWLWLNTVETVRQVAGQAYSELPRDYGHMPRLQPANINTRCSLVTIDELQALRGSSDTTGGVYYGAIFDGMMIPSDTGVPTPRIEWFPTPNVSGVIGSLIYKRVFRRVSNADTSMPVAVPAQLLGPFVRLARAFAMGREDMANQAAAEKAAAMEELTVFIERDMRSRLNYGRATGGADRFAQSPFGRVGKTADVIVEFGG